MRITESIWSPQQPDAPAGAARPRRADDGRRADVPPVAAQIYVLDTDHDGWIDEDDLPYDQLLLLERARAARAAEEQAAPESPVPVEPSAVSPAFDTAAPVSDPGPPAAERDTPRVDLLA